MSDYLVGKSWNPIPAKNHQQYELRTWLRLPSYFMDTTKDMRPREQIIKHISNKEGGAHYDEKIVTSVEVLSRATIWSGIQQRQYNGIQMLLLDMAALVDWVGTRMILVWKCRQNGIDEKTNQEIIDLDKYYSGLEILIETQLVEFLGPD